MALPVFVLIEEAADQAGVGGRRLQVLSKKVSKFTFELGRLAVE